MRTTIDIPDNLLKKAKKKAVDEGTSLKNIFIRSLERELGEQSTDTTAPWKSLKGKGSANNLKAQDSGFEGYTGPDWNSGIQVNEP
jgi:hypothetical protein